MVVRRKERIAVDLLIDILHDRLRDAHAIIGARTASDLVQNDKTVLRRMPKDVGYLLHFHHEGTLPRRNVIRRADARENAIDRREDRAPCGNERAHLRHDGEDGDLTHVGRLTGHIRPRDDQDLLIPMIQLRIIRDEHVSLQGMLDHRMTAVFDGNIPILRANDRRTDVAVLDRCPRKACEAVHRCERARRLLHIRDLRTDFRLHRLIDLKLELLCFFFGRERLRLEFLQFRRDIALRIHERLLSHIVRRDRELIRIGDLKIVSEDIIEADLELDARLFLFLLFQLLDVLLAVLRQRAHFIQLGGEAFADVLAVLDVARPVLIHRTVQKVKDRAMRRELAVQLLQKHRACAGEELLHLRHHAKRRFEREQVFGRSRIRLDAGKNTLEVKDAGKHLFQT